MDDYDYDVLVIGSGFGGSVSALRLTEKGYRVGVFESGRRWDADSAAEVELECAQVDLGAAARAHRTAAHQPARQVHRVQRGRGRRWFDHLRQYALPAARAFYLDPHWAHITDWKAELAPYYDQAKRMLGVNPNPRMTPADEVLKQVADDIGVGDTFHATDVGVFFGEGHEGQEVDDPYFGGAGPRRAGCIHCARCFTGCPHNAKNTTPTNYLYLAEQLGRTGPLAHNGHFGACP